MMKKLFLLFLFPSIPLWAENQVIKFDPKSMDGDNVEVHLPEGYYDASKKSISIKFDSKKNYQVVVKTESNETVGCFLLNTDGSSNNYYLPSLETGVNYIYIENDSNSYVGEIFVDEN